MNSILACFGGKTELKDAPACALARVHPHEVTAELTLGDYTACSFGNYVFVSQGKVDFAQPCTLKIMAQSQILGEVQFTTTIQSLIPPVPVWISSSIYHQVKGDVIAARFESFDSTYPNRGLLIGVTVSHSDFGVRDFVFEIVPKQ